MLEEPDPLDPAPPSDKALFENEREAYELLREEKNRIARELDTAAYHIAQNRALMAMVRCVPGTCEELLECWGWGASKCAAHGERLLGVLEPRAAELQKAQSVRVEEAQAAQAAQDQARGNPHPAPPPSQPQGY